MEKHEARITLLEDKAERCHKKIFGNGVKGLLDRTTHTEERIANMSEDLATMAATVKGLLELSQKEAGAKEMMRRTILQSTALAGTLLGVASIVVALIIK